MDHGFVLSHDYPQRTHKMVSSSFLSSVFGSIQCKESVMNYIDFMDP